jgi:hypothetical protein
MGQRQGKGRRIPGEETGENAKSEPARNRKHYLKPAFRFERVFETQALSCGKISSHFTPCHLNPKTS